LNIPKKCPLVLLVKIAWNQGGVLRSKEDRVMVQYVDCWEYAAEGNG